MAMDDIYLVTNHFENPSGASSFGLFYKETVARSGVGTDTSVLANSWHTALSALLEATFSNDWTHSAVVCRKMIVNPAPVFRVDTGNTPGGRTGPGLPANNSMLVSLFQGSFPSSSNGRINVPGVAEPDTNVGALSAAYIAAAVTPFLAGLVAILAEESAGLGRWQLGVISRLVLDAAPPAKDWAGAFSPVFATQVNPVIATQRRRQTRVIGASG